MRGWQVERPQSHYDATSFFALQDTSFCKYTQTPVDVYGTYVHTDAFTYICIYLSTFVLYKYLCIHDLAHANELGITYIEDILS